MSSRLTIVAVAVSLFAVASASTCGNCLQDLNPSVSYGAGLSAQLLFGNQCPADCPIRISFDIEYCVTKVASGLGGHTVQPRYPFIYEFFPGSGGTLYLTDTASPPQATIALRPAILSDDQGNTKQIFTYAPICPTTSSTGTTSTGTTGTTGAPAPATTGPSNGCHAVCGDPHFYGLDGTKFEFKGEVDKTFAIISDPTVQLNSRFIRGPGRTHMTFLGKTCLRVCNNTVVMDMPEHIRVNGHYLVRNERYSVPGLTVFRNDKHIAEVEVQNRWKFQFDIGNHIDIHTATALYKFDNRTHGVLGQTLGGLHEASKCNSRLEGGCSVEGSFADYEVDGDLCSTVWTHSKFDDKMCA